MKILVFKKSFKYNNYLVGVFFQYRCFLVNIAKFLRTTPPVPASRHTPLTPLIKTRNKKGKALDLPSILISFSNTRNKKANSFTRQIELTRVNNGKAVTHKSWMARCSTQTQGFSLSKLHNCIHFQDRNFFYTWCHVLKVRQHVKRCSRML